MFGSIIVVVTLCLTSSCEGGSPYGTSNLCGGPALELHHLAPSLGIGLMCCWKVPMHYCPSSPEGKRSPKSILLIVNSITFVILANNTSFMVIS